MRLSAKLAQMAAFPRLVSCGGVGGWKRGLGGNDVNLVACANWWQLESVRGSQERWWCGRAHHLAQLLCVHGVCVHGAEAQPTSPSTWCWRRDQGYMPALINAGPSSPSSLRECRLARSSALQCEPSLDQGIFFSFPEPDWLSLPMNSLDWCSWSEVALMHLAAQPGSVNMRLRGRRRVNIGHLPILWHQLTLRTN